MKNVREWYLGGMVNVQDGKESATKQTPAMDAYEITQPLKDKLNAVIADEFLAFITYRFCRIAVTGNKQNLLDRITGDNGFDELEDHFRKLADWMQSKGIEVVTSVKEMEKITNCTVFTVKDKTDSKEILDILIQSENEAISAYEKLLDDEAVKYDLRTMLSDFLKDEREHLKKLTDAKAELSK